MTSEKNNNKKAPDRSTPKGLLYGSLRAILGLFIFAFGCYLTIQGNIGASPWDVFELGLSGTFGVSYGVANITVSLIIVCVDICMRESIGLGMIYDAILVGLAVDLYGYIGIIPLQNNLWSGVALTVAGVLLQGFSMYYYMSAGIGCGPRDSLLVGLSRRMKKVPIGAISIVIMTVVTLAGWLLGGKAGLGTLICAFGTGPSMQTFFRIMRFDPTGIHHINLLETKRILFGGSRR